MSHMFCQFISFNNDYAEYETKVYSPRYKHNTSSELTHSENEAIFVSMAQEVTSQEVTGGNSTYHLASHSVNEHND